MGRRDGGREPKILDGKLTLSRPSGGRTGEARIVLRFEDTTSSLLILEAELTPADFAEGCFGLALRPCKVTFFEAAVDRLGKVHEIKSIRVPCPHGEFPEAEARKHETDGWILHVEKFNHHNYGGGTYSCHYDRWVDAPVEPVSPPKPALPEAGEAKGGSLKALAEKHLRPPRKRK